MNIEDQIWELVAKKLSKEASKEELRQLDTLLWENPRFYHVLKLMFEWWDDSGVLSELEDEENYRLFAKVMTSIKDEGFKTEVKPDIAKLQNRIQQTGDFHHKEPGKNNLIAFFNKQISMMHSYLKIAWRSLLKSKVHTSL